MAFVFRLASLVGVSRRAPVRLIRVGVDVLLQVITSELIFLFLFNSPCPGLESKELSSQNIKLLGIFKAFQKPPSY